MTRRLLLIRHGESEWNRSSRYAGQRDIPLTERGREQARLLAQRLEDESLGAIYSSPLQRARETAAIIASRKCLPVLLDAGLAEIHHGAWQGMTGPEVAARFPNEYNRWLSDPHVVQMPGGEGLEQVADRVRSSLHRILARRCDGSVVICAHDAVLRVLALDCLNVGLEHFWKLSFDNASLSVLVERDEGARLWTLTSLNDTTHLVGAISEYALQAL